MKLFLSSEAHFTLHLMMEKLGWDKSIARSVGYIANAADLDEDHSWMKPNREAFINNGFEIVDINLRVTHNEALYSALENVDAIYMEGGNTFYLLDVCNRSGATSIIKKLVLNKGKIYIGTSAGSILAGPNIESSKYLDDLSVVPNLRDYTGLGLVNFVVIPHIGNDDFFKSFEHHYRELFLNLKNYKYPHICLRDTQGVFVEDGKFEILE